MEREWFTMGTQDNSFEVESVGKFPLVQTEAGDYICPQCGKVTEYDEGQIDQDSMGNNIDGWWFNCWDCRIASEPVEGSFND